MARLPETSEWREDQIAQKLKFLERGAVLEKSAVGKVSALCEAAELCLATGDTSKAAEFVHRCTELLFDKEDKSVPSQFALLGAAFGNVEVSVSSVGMIARRRLAHWADISDRRMFQWGGPSKFLMEGIGIAIAATLASNHASPSSLLSLVGESTGPADDFGLLGIEETRRIALLATNSPEADFLPCFGLRRTSKGFIGEPAFVRGSPWPCIQLLYSMEVHYGRGIRLAAQDNDWQNLYSRVPLIDWRLLCLEIAMLYRYEDQLPGSFVRDLADEIRTMRDRTVLVGAL
jgi:hypothetical protein